MNKMKQFKTVHPFVDENGEYKTLFIDFRYDTYFSITGSIWRGTLAREPTNESRLECCGCVHSYIKKYSPEYAPFLKWHLVDGESGPMHYIANTLYWAKEGNLKNAQSCAVWPDATLEDITRDALKARLPDLMKAFKKDMKLLGFDI